jgi:thiosulfate/3-mercaptopyruvate sulfurtransferase
VLLLDGGFAAWQEAGYPVATGEPDQCAPGDFTAEPGHLPTLETDAVAGFAEDGLLLDVRSAPRYRGEDPMDRIRGHIPGAHSAPTIENVDDAGRWRSVGELASRYDALGASGKPVAVYCGSGVTACHTALAMSLTGAPIPALYVGSWSEWSAQGRAVETGPPS